MNRLKEKEESIQDTLNRCNYIGSKIIYYDSIGSTMEEARRLIEGTKEAIPDGTVVIAEEQTAGRGRYGRYWHSPPDGIYLSILFYREIEPQKQGLLSLMAGVVSCKVIMRYIKKTGKNVNIKWPNDILVEDKKICGTLIEKLGNYYSVGIGINSNTEEFPQNFIIEPTSIYLETGRKILNDFFIVKFLTIFDSYYSSLVERDYKRIIKDWKSLTSTKPGKKVKLRTPKEENDVIIRGIDENGFLVVEDTEGNLETIVSGEI